MQEKEKISVNNPYSAAAKTCNADDAAAKCETAKAETNPDWKSVQALTNRHVLMYHPWGTISHRSQQQALLIGLLDEGTTVTGVFPEKSNIIHDNYTEIVVETRYIPQKCCVMSV